jgi:DnaJ homolog subfamily C member 1
MEEHVASKLKKMQRKAKKKKQNDISEEVLEEMEQLLTKPTFKNTLPFQFFNFIISIPSLCLSLKLMIEEIRRARQEKIQKEKEEAEELERLKKEIEEEKEREKERKSHRRKRILPDLSNEPEECILDAVDEPNQQVFLVISDTCCQILIQLFSG